MKEYKSRKNSLWTPEVKSQLKVLYPLIPNKCLAEIFNTNEKCISQQGRRLGLRKNKREPYKPIGIGMRRRFDISLSEILRLKSQFMTMAEVCSELNICANTYYTHIKGKTKYSKGELTSEENKELLKMVYSSHKNPRKKLINK